MAYRMGRSGYEVTDAMERSQAVGPSHSVKKATRTKSRDQKGSRSGSDPMDHTPLVIPEKDHEGTVIQGTIQRDHKYIRDSYYYQR